MDSAESVALLHRFQHLQTDLNRRAQLGGLFVADGKFLLKLLLLLLKLRLHRRAQRVQARACRVFPLDHFGFSVAQLRALLRVHCVKARA